jgi:glycosyltransferase involved in cell wall biosynthesis
LSKKIAIAHDFFFQNGGAENVVESLLEIFPDATIFTTIFIPTKFTSNPNLYKAWQESRIKVTFAQSFFVWKNGFWLKYFKHFFWLYPILMRFVLIKNFDSLIISSTDCAKQVRVSNVRQILNYCHTPTRYLHNLVTEQDHNSLSFVYRFVLPVFKFCLKKLDLNAVNYLNKNNCIWLANSKYIQGLIKVIYKTDSIVVYPPVNLNKFQKIVRKVDNQDPFYLCHGRISFHKRLDVAILACLELNKKLKISGTSGLPAQMKDLELIVRNYCLKYPEKLGLIEFLGRTSDDQLEDLISSCQGFLFPGKEDFGIAPVEMLASGVPIIAFESGGALEYVQHKINGLLVKTQEVEDWKKAILEFEEIQKQNLWEEKAIKESSKNFDQKIFQNKFKELIELS